MVTMFNNKESAFFPDYLSPYKRLARIYRLKGEKKKAREIEVNLSKIKNREDKHVRNTGLSYLNKAYNSF